MKTKLIPIALVLMVLGFMSCQQEDVKGSGTLLMEFDNVAVVTGGQVQPNLEGNNSTDYDLTNGLGQEFNITLLRYFISKVVLEGPNGEYWADELNVSPSETKGIYLVDEAVSGSGEIDLINIPAGTYNKVQFTVGVDEEGVTEGAAGGVLDAATNNMFWNWNSGYIALKFEGNSPASNGGVSGVETLDSSSVNGIAYHIGGWKDIPGTAFVYNNKDFSFDFDTDIKIEEGLEPNLHITLDVLKLFTGVNDIDFSGPHNVHKPSDGVSIAENMINAFEYDHVHQ